MPAEPVETDVPVSLPCGHVASASHVSGDRLWACGCVEDVDANDPAAGTKPVQWALVAHRITTVTYSPKKL